MLVDSVRRELTDLVDKLRPQSMDGDDFSETLKGYGAEWSHRSGIKLNVHVEGSDKGLQPVTRESLFRIAQEALANVARHSSASRVELSIEYGKDAVTLIIKDDGRGFDISAPHSGLGLHSMQERAAELAQRLTDLSPAEERKRFRKQREKLLLRRELMRQAG